MGAAISGRGAPPRGAALDVEIDTGTDVEAAPAWQALRRRLWQSMGPVRDGATLAAAIAETRAMLAGLPAGQRVLRQRHELALAMLHAAASREESRGAHFRRDFPTRDESRDGPRAVYPRAVA